MKKLLVMLIGAALSLSFFSCGDADDGNNNKASSVTPVGAEVAAESTGKNADYNKDVSVDLSKNPLTDESVTAIKNGEVNLSEYFRQSRVDASSSRAATGADDKGLDDFEVILKEVTNIKIDVTITAKTPDSDCTVLITAVVPAEATKSGKPAISLVTQVNVGDSAGESSITKIDGLTIPTAGDVNGLILKESEEYDENEYVYTKRNYYYEFTNEAENMIVKKYKSSDYGSGETIRAQPDEKYSYDPKSGVLNPVKESDNSTSFNDISKSLGTAGLTYHLVKVGSKYYIYTMKLERSSGKDLDSTFTTKIDLSESIEGTNFQGKNITMASVSGSFDCAVSTTSKGVFTGASETSMKISLSPEYKKMMETMAAFSGATLEDFNFEDMNKTQIDNIDFTGVYVNKGGILYVDGKSVLNASTGKDVKEFENEIIFYDGNNLYFAEHFETVSSLPEKSNYN